MTPERKAVAAAPAGTAWAKVSAYNVLHGDGDVVRPGSLRNQWATVSPRGHRTFLGLEPPVGFARLSEEADGLYAEITYHPGEDAACERAREALWSVGYVVESSHTPTDEERAKFGDTLKRVITAWRIIELSPVEEPASPATASGEVCCGGTCTVGGKSCCGQCEREAVVRELVKHERLKFQFLLMGRLDALKAPAIAPPAIAPRAGHLRPEEAHEILAGAVPAKTRAAAEEAVVLAAAILGGSSPPAVKWFDPAHIGTVDALGSYYHGDRHVWLAGLDDEEEVFNTAAHEVAHAKGLDEPAAQRFAGALSMLRGVELHVGPRARFEGESRVRHHVPGLFCPERVRVGALEDGALVVEAGVLYERTEDGWRTVAPLVPA